MDKSREEPSGCVRICRRRRIVRFLRSAEGLNIGAEGQELFRRMKRGKTRRNERRNERIVSGDVRRRAEEIRSKLRQEKGAVVETGSLKKTHHFRS